MKKKVAPNHILSLLCISILTVLFVATHPNVTAARMKRLTHLQNGVFHLSQTDLVFTSKTFYTDRFIDDEQANDFMLASKAEPYLPADQDYPFTLIDHHVLDSDLEILYKYDTIGGCPFPTRAYLSRHNISIADYTNQKYPPEVFLNVITGEEPYYNERVKAVYWKLTNHEVYQDEYLHKSVSPKKVRYVSVQEPGACPGTVRYKTVPEIIEDCYPAGYMIDAYVRVISGCVSVWVGESHPPCKPLKRVPLPKSPCPGVVTAKQEIIQLTRMPLYGAPYTCMERPSPRVKEKGPCPGVFKYKPAPKTKYAFPTGQTYASETTPAPVKNITKKTTQCATCR